MDKKLKTKWVKALRSGRYKQTGNTLYDGESYCCLGVLCRVAGAKFKGGAFHFGGDHDDVELPDALLKKSGMKFRTEQRLIGLNDDQGKTFDEIADYIEKRL